MRQRSLSAYTLLFLTSLAVFGHACTTSDADDLAKRPPVIGAGGMAGALPMPTATATIPTSVTGGTSNELPSLPRRTPEPRGLSEVTFVNGVVDREAVALCFAEGSAEGGWVPLTEQPWPPAGLAFGLTAKLEAPPGFDPSSKELVVLVADARVESTGIGCSALFSGGLSAASAFDQAQGDALNQAGAAGQVAPGHSGAAGANGAGGAEGPPFGGAGGVGGMVNEPEPDLRRVARLLTLLPQKTFDGGFHYLLVAAGCLGGEGLTHPREEEACGSGYSAKLGSLTPVVVPLSRITQFSAAGMQVLNASLATPKTSVNSLKMIGDNPIPIVQDVGFSELLPHPPQVSNKPEDYLSGPTSILMANGVAFNWNRLLNTAGIAELKVGANYTAIAIGSNAAFVQMPEAELSLPPYWHPFSLILVQNTEERAVQSASQ